MLFLLPNRIWSGSAWLSGSLLGWGGVTQTLLHSLSVWVLSPFSHVQLFATLWTVARQASLSTGFYRQEYWSGLPCLPPEGLPDPGTESTSVVSPLLQANSLPTEPPAKKKKSRFCPYVPLSKMTPIHWNLVTFATGTEIAGWTDGQDWSLGRDSRDIKNGNN